MTQVRNLWDAWCWKGRERELTIAIRRSTSIHAKCTSARCHCTVCDQIFFISMLPSLSMPLPSNHYLLKIHFHLPRNIRYTIPFPIPPERIIQELKVMTNPAKQAFHGKHASTSSTRSQHAASRQDSFTRSNTPAKCSDLTRSNTPASQSGPDSVCCSNWTASQLLFVFFFLLFGLIFAATENQPNSNNKNRCKV